MIPSELNLLVWRGTTFEIELVSQVKNFIFDPVVHNSPADLKRTHAENLEYYGFTYDYLNFASVYNSADLVVMPPWRQKGDENRAPLLSLTVAAGGIQFTSTSVKVGISAEATQLIDFDSGTYKLLLHTTDGKTDGLIYGDFDVKGER